MNNEFRIVIPARYESSRLQGKVLLAIAGKPMLQHVWERAVASGAADIVIATDSERVADVARAFGADVCLTGAECRSGTDRVAEVCLRRDWDDNCPVVNVQGDAPLMPPSSIARVANLLNQYPSASVATLCTPLKSANDYADANVVKVVFDSAGRALYFSRAPIPAAGHGSSIRDAATQSYRHLGLYAYRPDALRRLSAAPPCELEQLERLEQLRALWMGMEIRIEVDTESHGPDVDTQADLERVEALLRGSGQ
jgi:3-deoxy-manno-octulosonate cytidylyltransferase (CMP-KDO synthetase)